MCCSHHPVAEEAASPTQEERSCRQSHRFCTCLLCTHYRTPCFHVYHERSHRSLIESSDSQQSTIQSPNGELSQVHPSFCHSTRDQLALQLLQAAMGIGAESPPSHPLDLRSRPLPSSADLPTGLRGRRNCASIPAEAGPFPAPQRRSRCPVGLRRGSSMHCVARRAHAFRASHKSGDFR